MVRFLTLTFTVTQHIKLDEEIAENDTSIQNGLSENSSDEIVKSKIKVVNGDTTRIKIFGSEIEVVDDDGSKEILFDSRKDWGWDNDYKQKNRRRSNKFTGHYWGLDLGLNNYVNADGELSLPDGYNYLSLNTGKSFEVSVNALQQNIGLGQCVGFVNRLGFNI